jgi:hypothetical protein
MVLYGAQTCAVFDHRVACWNVVSSNQASFGSLMTGKVGISGHPGVAWVPQNVVLLRSRTSPPLGRRSLQTDPIVHSIAKPLLAAKIALSGLNRYMTK